jgi:DNA-binding response OmpR family regulator
MFSWLRKKIIRYKPLMIYVDPDPMYQQAIVDMLSAYYRILVAANYQDVATHMHNYAQPIDIIFMCIDDIPYDAILTKIFKETGVLPRLVFSSARRDQFEMYDAVSKYGAEDFVKKPLSQERLCEHMYAIFNRPMSVSRLRNIRDIYGFNDVIDRLNNKLEIHAPYMVFDTLERWVQVLEFIKRQLTPFYSFEDPYTATILFVDDEESIVYGYQKFMENKNFKTIFSKTLASARAILAEKSVDVIVLDLGLPDGNGGIILNDIFEKNPIRQDNPEIMVVSSYLEKKMIIDILNRGAKLFLNKPITYDKFMNSIYQLAFLKFMRSQLKMLLRDL